MISLTAKQLNQLFTASDPLPESLDIYGVQTDSRKDCSGALFVAIKGERFDAHEYLAQAREQGAVAAIVEYRVADELPQLVVKDTRLALAALARFWRQKINPTLIAITGSNGKTTVKEMLGAILGQQSPTLVTEGNLNNDIGVPLTLFRLQPQHRFAVIEMGANHRHEIEHLVTLAQPDVVYVNNARQAHLEGFGSLQGVIEAKGEMYRYCPENALAVFNLDEAAAAYWKSNCASDHQIGFSMTDAVAEVNGRWQSIPDGLQLEVSSKVADQQQQVSCSVAVYGAHNAQNALAAMTLARVCGGSLTDACAGLKHFIPVKGRLQTVAGRNSSLLLDDSYNANPDSFKAAIDVLCSLDGEAWLAMGDMGELGEDSNSLHRDVAEYAKQTGVKRMFAIGKFSSHAAVVFTDRGETFESIETMSDRIAADLKKGVNVLIKGSRTAGMERLVKLLADDSTGNATAEVLHAV